MIRYLRRPVQYPYIGITGFMPGDSVTDLLSLLPGRPEQAPKLHDLPCCRLMAGYLVSEKTLHGNPNRWPKRYPPVAKLAELLMESDDMRALNLVHYNTKGASGVSLGDQMIAVHEAAQRHPNLDGFQLNVAWPERRDLSHYRSWRAIALETTYDAYIVLQIGAHAFEMVEHDPKQLVTRLHRYGNAIDYILLDPSGGAGVHHGPEFFRPYLKEIYSEERLYAVGIAGGFGPGKLATLTALLPEFPWLSIDAEGQLRDAEDNLDPELAKAYLTEAISIFKEHQPR